MKRLFWLVLIVLAAGCARQEPAFVWQVDRLPDNLDPQVAQGESNLLALQHLYRGLFRLDADGNPVKDGCSRYTVRNYIYDITICNDNLWQDNTPVTAQDYAFALRRCLDAHTGSPYAEAFSAILDIAVPRSDTLRITVKPGTDLPRLLAQAGAYPCRADFFEQCLGQYGLTRRTTLGNGAFYLQGWGTAVFTLGRTRGEGVRVFRLVLPDSSMTPSGCVTADDSGSAAVTWALALNPAHPALCLPALRQAIAALCYDADLTLPAGGVPAFQLLPPILGRGAPLPEGQDPEPLIWDATEVLGVRRITGLVILTAPELLPQAQQLDQQLESRLGIFCRIETLPLAELRAKIDRGDYSLALLPCVSDSADRARFLAGCAALCGLPEDAGEQDIFASCCLVPLFYQRLALHTSEGWQGLGFSPFSRLPDLSGAVWYG